MDSTPNGIKKWLMLSEKLMELMMNGLLLDHILIRCKIAKNFVGASNSGSSTGVLMGTFRILKGV